MEYSRIVRQRKRNERTDGRTDGRTEGGNAAHRNVTPRTKSVTATHHCPQLPTSAVVHYSITRNHCKPTTTPRHNDQQPTQRQNATTKRNDKTQRHNAEHSAAQSRKDSSPAQRSATQRCARAQPQLVGWFGWTRRRVVALKISFAFRNANDTVEEGFVAVGERHCRRVFVYSLRPSVRSSVRPSEPGYMRLAMPNALLAMPCSLLICLWHTAGCLLLTCCLCAAYCCAFILRILMRGSVSTCFRRRVPSWFPCKMLRRAAPRRARKSQSAIDVAFATSTCLGFVRVRGRWTFWWGGTVEGWWRKGFIVEKLGDR